MSQTIFILFGVLTAIGVLLVSYPTYLYIMLRLNEKKVKEVYLQVKGQVDTKCELALTINNKELRSVIKEYTKDKKENYNLDLKYYNETFNKYIYAYASKDIIVKCNEAEEKINHVKDYYNEVVSAHNEFKSNRVTSYLSKSFLINDGKLY